MDKAVFIRGSRLQRPFIKTGCLFCRPILAAEDFGSKEHKPGEIEIVAKARVIKFISAIKKALIA